MRRLAVGCSTFAVSRTVTPSLVTTISPFSSTSILSEPLGPKVDLTAPASARAALVLFTRAERPSIRSVSSKATSCSDSTMCIANQRPAFNAMSCKSQCIHSSPVRALARTRECPIHRLIQIWQNTRTIQPQVE